MIDDKKVETAEAYSEEKIRELPDAKVKDCLFLLMVTQQVILILSKLFPSKSKNWKPQHPSWWKKFLWSAN